MGFILNVIDENGNEIPFNRVKVTNCCPVTKGCDEITIQIFNAKPIFDEDEIKLILRTLRKSLHYGGSYHRMKKIVDLIDKLNEENTINE